MFLIKNMYIVLCNSATHFLAGWTFHGWPSQLASKVKVNIVKKNFSPKY